MMGAVEILGISSVTLSHLFAKITFRGFYQNMMLVAHQAVVIHNPILLFNHLAHDLTAAAPIVSREGTPQVYYALE